MTRYFLIIACLSLGCYNFSSAEKPTQPQLSPKIIGILQTIGSLTCFASLADIIYVDRTVGLCMPPSVRRLHYISIAGLFFLGSNLGYNAIQSFFSEKKNVTSINDENI